MYSSMALPIPSPGLFHTVRVGRHRRGLDGRWFSVPLSLCIRIPTEFNHVLLFRLVAAVDTVGVRPRLARHNSAIAVSSGIFVFWFVGLALSFWVRKYRNQPDLWLD